MLNKECFERINIQICDVQTLEQLQGYAVQPKNVYFWANRHETCLYISVV